MDSFTRRGSCQCIHDDEYFETYLNPHPFLTTADAPLLHRAAGAAPVNSPTWPLSMLPRSAADAGLAAGPPREPDHAARAREPASGGRAGASSGAPAVARSALRQAELVDSMPAAILCAPATTTLMIRNIPMSVAQSDLLDLIDKTGFENRYDYAYMPTIFDSGTTRGIAFVNFATSSDAREFSILWNGSRLAGVAGAGTNGAVIEVTVSETQGYSENARKWKASRLRRIRNPKFHPFIAPKPAAS
ncbi:unnamed protein product [Prorocentrum cordatum]|uniref:RRM domain-containing protein n=1 Tax=Prorocentrum cordatum TaxID=2364126 RepID=A0ABN9VB79_9DINO|nr:unnamed protein product [Polarella glacialis]